ncbi:MAG: hypothetical protein AAFY72_18875 [Cyanobacteria bacterium J06649_4]
MTNQLTEIESVIHQLPTEDIHNLVRRLLSYLANVRTTPMDVEALTDTLNPAVDSQDWPYDPDATPIWEITAKIAAEVPDEEWAKLPADLSKRFDHYQQQRAE